MFQAPGSAWAQGSKAKQVGRFSTTVFLQVVDTYRKFLTAAGLSDDEIDEIIPAVKRELLDLRIHWYLEVLATPILTSGALVDTLCFPTVISCTVRNLCLVMGRIWSYPPY
jgi:hypothetical protein